MSETALVPGKKYWFKTSARRTSCEIQSIRYGVDVNSLQRSRVASLALNAIGCCHLRLHDPIVFDRYDQNRTTGSFILVDRITHETVAAGMLIDRDHDLETNGHWDEASTMLSPQPARSLISAEQRQQRYGQRPRTILVTGLSCSGKTSVALELEKRLFEQGGVAIVLDGQTMRMGISRDLGFTAEERSENLRRAAEIARLINDAGQICIAAFVAPSEWVREKARELIGPDRFIHVHLSTPVNVCRQRDVTGQYQAADRGEITSFPGVTFDYESPSEADLTFDTSELSIQEVADAILAECF